MGSAILLAAAGAFAAFTWQSSGSSAGNDADAAVAAAGFSDTDRAAVEAIVRDYILANPEIIPEAVERLQQRQVTAQLDDLRDQIETPFATAWAGNPDGDVVLVEFSDFSCGFCRQSVADVERLLASDPDLKIVFRELPILSDASTDAAAMALAAARQDKYYEFHTAMFAAGKPGPATIAAAARTAGLDLTAASRFAASDEVAREIESNVALAQALRFTGTPSWIVGDQVLIGAVGYEELKAAIDAEREGGGASGSR